MRPSRTHPNAISKPRGYWYAPGMRRGLRTHIGGPTGARQGTTGPQNQEANKTAVLAQALWPKVPQNSFFCCSPPVALGQDGCGGGHSVREGRDGQVKGRPEQICQGSPSVAILAQAVPADTADTSPNTWTPGCLLLGIRVILQLDSTPSAAFASLAARTSDQLDAPPLP